MKQERTPVRLERTPSGQTMDVEETLERVGEPLRLDLDLLSGSLLDFLSPLGIDYSKSLSRTCQLPIPPQNKKILHFFIIV